MVDSVAFTMRHSRDVQVGEYIWVDGLPYRIREIRSSGFKDGARLFHLVGHPPVRVAIDDHLKVTT
jgi:hypothetical protein